MPGSSTAASDELGAIKGTSEQIAERLRGEIERGSLAPGTFLNQVALAGRFGLSRIPVREALRQLNAEGYVTYRPNKGATVVGAMSPRDLEEIFEIRMCVESRLMDHVVRHCTRAVLEQADDALRAMNRIATGKAEMRGQHQRFHTLLFEAAHRPRMTAIVNDWRFRLDGPGDDEPRARAFVRATIPLHQRLLEVCEKGDRRAVQRCVTEEYEVLRSFVLP